jgi:hypothetical protein
MEDFEKAVLELKGIKKPKWDNYWFGLVIGIFLPLLFIFIYWMYSYSFMNFIPTFFSYLIKGKVLAPVLSMCLVPILAVFYFFLNSEKYKTIKGILTAVFLYGFIILYLKIFVEETLF